MFLKVKSVKSRSCTSFTTLQLQLYPSLSGDTLQLLEQWLLPGRSLETDIATHKTHINTHRHYTGETQRDTQKHSGGEPSKCSSGPLNNQVETK